MLGGRKIKSTLIREMLEGSGAKGLPQRGILLPNSCAAWLQTKSQRGSKGMDRIH